MVLVTIKTFLHLPLFDIVLRTLEATSKDDTLDLTNKVIRIAICVGTLAALSLAMFFIMRIFHLSVPSEQLPWCAPYSMLSYVTIIIKALSVGFVTLDPQGHLAIYEICILLFLICFQSAYRIMFVPQYNEDVDFVFKSKDFMLALIYFIGLLCRLLKDMYSLDLVYFIVFCPVVSVGWSTADNLRNTFILNKIKRNTTNISL